MSEFDNPELFRSVLEQLPVGVYLVDSNRRILFWNSGAESISGYLSQDVVGHFLRDHLIALNGNTKDSEKEPYDPLSEAFRDGKTSAASVSILHKQGFRIPVVLQTIPIRNGDGNVIGVTECFTRHVSALNGARRQIADLECLDGATGAPTQTFMERHLRERMAVFAERHTPVGVLVINIDSLDKFRAMRGPGVVPAILRVVAQTVTNCLRPTDVVGCWSENRFLALLTDCRETEIEAVASRVGKMIGQSEVEWWGDTFSVTAAFGGAGSRPGDSPESLAKRAEQSLLESVAAGGNCVKLVS